MRTTSNCTLNGTLKLYFEHLKYATCTSKIWDQATFPHTCITTHTAESQPKWDQLPKVDKKVPHLPRGLSLSLFTKKEATKTTTTNTIGWPRCLRKQ